MAILAIPAAGGFDAINATAPGENLSFLGIKKSGLIPAISLAVSIAVGVLAGATLFHIGISLLTPKNNITSEKALEIINLERKRMDI